MRENPNTIDFKGRWNGRYAYNVLKGYADNEPIPINSDIVRTMIDDDLLRIEFNPIDRRYYIAITFKGLWKIFTDKLKYESWV